MMLPTTDSSAPGVGTRSNPRTIHPRARSSRTAARPILPADPVTSTVRPSVMVASSGVSVQCSDSRGYTGRARSGRVKVHRATRRTMIIRSATLLIVLCLPCCRAPAGDIPVTSRMRHLRVAGEREWSDFPAQPDGPSLSLTFRAHKNDGEWALRLRQQDVKQTWKVLLNGKDIGRLAADE